MSLVGIELENGGVLLKFTQTAAETNGLLHVQEARYPPHSAPPPLHRHPLQEERFVIVQGQLYFKVGQEAHALQAGQELKVPKGVLHAAHNPGDTPTLVIWETRPALRTAEFFMTMERASRWRARPPLFEAAAILSEYSDEFELAKPPRLIQRFVFGCLAPFGRNALQSAER